MAYADEGISRKRLFALGVVGLLHAFLGYALVTGLALKAVKVITEPLDTFEVEEVKPPEEEPPPPPPKLDEIPPYVPPPDVIVETSAPPPPPITIQTETPRPEPVRVVPPPPAPSGPTTPATPRGKLGASITTDDYPPASIRAEEEGQVVAQYEVNEQGRVTPGSCRITKPSGFSRLDARTCELVERRFRFNPALSNGTPVKASRSQSFRWVLPKD
jgi:periplasmic protein TonB